jgi:hypothetical protein
MHLGALFGLGPRSTMTPENEATLLRFLRTQPVIRAVIDKTGNFGNQAATYNLIQRLRQLGFTGVIELIYFKTAQAKISQLFGLKELTKNSYFCEETAIEFIEFNHYLKKIREGALDYLPLGLSGAIDSKPSDWASIHHNNYADFFRVKSFIRFSPYYNVDEICNTEIYFSGQKAPLIQAGSCAKLLITPIASFYEAAAYLATTPAGKAFSKQYPHLKTLMRYIESGNINFQPLYGWTLRDSPANLFNFILGARFAQRYGGDVFKKPLVLGAFFDLKQSTILLKKLNTSSNNLAALQFLLGPSWDLYEEEPGAKEAKKAAEELRLKDALQFAELKEATLALQLAQLGPDKILLLSFPTLPKIIFDGLFTHAAPNVLSPVREGASSFTSLIVTRGRPHIHCRSAMDWEINLNLAPVDLAQDLFIFNKIICPCPYFESLNFANWQHYPIHQWIGSYLVSAEMPQSPLSSYFRQLQKEALKPGNDRIVEDLSETVGYLEREATRPTQDLFNAAQEPVSFVSDWVEETKKAATAYLSKQVRQAYQRVKIVLNKVRAKSSIESSSDSSGSSLIILQALKKSDSGFSPKRGLLDSLICKAQDIVTSCPSYFPPNNPFYWQSQGQGTLFFNPGTVKDLSLMRALTPSPFTPRLK